MEKGIVLQERDIELLKFLAEYKTITLDNSRYIYCTKTYQEKRICNLVKEKYVRRLKHREVAIGLKGKEYVKEIGIDIKEHCRNYNNMERLKVISDIAAFTKFSSTLNFSPSWHFKNRNSPTQDSRRYLGLLTFDNNYYNVYSVYEGKDDKYITSIYYDLKKERDIRNAIIFADDIEKILYYKNGFYFGYKHLYVIEYNEFNKKIMRNYDKIRTLMFNELSKRHEIEYTDYKYMDFLVDNEMYLKIMLFIDINQCGYLSGLIRENLNCRKNFYFICFEENEKYLNELIGDCNIITIEKSKVEKYIKQQYIEISGTKFEFPSENYNTKIKWYY